jgi:hypothetical protein
MRFGGDGKIQEPRGVVLLHLPKLSTTDQLLGRKLLDRLKHGKARVGRRFSIRRLFTADQTGIVECVQAVEDRERWSGPEANDTLRGIECPAAGEDRQSSEEGLFGAPEKIMTPGDRSP